MFYSPTIHFISNLNHYYMICSQNVTFLRNQVSTKFAQLCQKIRGFAQQIFRFLLEVVLEAKKDYCAFGIRPSNLQIVEQRLHRIDGLLAKKNFRTKKKIEHYKPQQKIVPLSPTDVIIKHKGTNHFENVPEEVFQNIFSFLGSTDLCQTAQVSHQWSSISSDSSLWKSLYHRDFGEIKNHPKVENWKELYQRDMQYLTQQKGKSVCSIKDPYSHIFHLNYNSQTCTVRYLKLMICRYMEIAPSYARIISLRVSGQSLTDTSLLLPSLKRFRTRGTIQMNLVINARNSFMKN